MSDTELMDQYIINDAEESGMSEETFLESMDLRWYQVQTYNDLLKLNIEFIEGKICVTPYHFGPLIVEGLDSILISNLVKLHVYGILSVEGQEPICEYEINMEDRWYSKEQRGFLYFHINMEDNLKLAESLTEQLQKKKNIVYKITNLKDGKCVTNILEDEKCFNLTRVIKNKHDLSWLNCTNLWHDTDRPGSSWGFITSPKIREILKNTMYFQIVLKEYGKDNLEEVLLDMCKNAQTKVSNLSQNH